MPELRVAVLVGIGDRRDPCEGRATQMKVTLLAVRGIARRKWKEAASLAGSGERDHRDPVRVARRK